jgi:hypothetical protein
MQRESTDPDAAEAWIAANTVECRPLHARHSRAQCGVNIADDVPQCSGCPEAALATAPAASARFRRKHAFGASGFLPKEKEEPDELENELETEPEQEDPQVQKPTYTLRELAELLGFTYADVTNAKHAKNPIPSGTSYAVLEAMRERGIAWDQIVPAKTARKESPVMPAMNQEALAEAAAEEEEPPLVVPNPFLSKEEIRVLMPPVAVTEEDDPAADPPLGKVRLESLITEITRRLPGAEIILRGGARP